MTGPRALTLNPDLAPEDFAPAFARDGVVQIRELLPAAFLDLMREVMLKATPWSVCYSDEHSRAAVIEPEVLRAGGAAVDAVARGVNARAGGQFSYQYLGFHLTRSYLMGRDLDHPLQQVMLFLNTSPVLDFVRKVTGEPAVDHVDAQATCYRPGDFLTVHNDRDAEQKRRVAYTLGLTRPWRPDWGGQLLFHDDGGGETRGFVPGFNVLTLFRVPRAHSVAPVAAYATAPRLSITGWFLDPDGAAAGA